MFSHWMPVRSLWMSEPMAPPSNPIVLPWGRRGAVGGVVGMLGALGGFFLPPAFGALGRWGGMPQLAFVPLLLLTVWSLLWLHVVVVRLRAERPLLDGEGRLPVQYTTASPL